jgi:DNA-binding transcriptional MerR regulator
VGGVDGHLDYSIGDLARRTGLTVKTIRRYSDRGLVPPDGRSSAGHRRYGSQALARLDLVRTLRDLGLGLTAIRTVMDRDNSLPEVAAAHAEALAAQIRTLRLRRAVLLAVAKRGCGPEEMELMHKLAKLSEAERRRLIDDFLGTAFGGLDGYPEFAGITRSLTADLPDDPTVEQVEAWVELAELAQDPGFRAAMRQLAQQYAAERAPDHQVSPRRDLVALVRDQVGPAMSAGIDPAAPAAEPVVAAVVRWYAGLVGRPDSADLRRRLRTRLVTANDPRRQRYLELLSVVNGWSVPQPLAPALDWFIEALGARSR